MISQFDILLQVFIPVPVSDPYLRSCIRSAFEVLRQIFILNHAWDLRSRSWISSPFEILHLISIWNPASDLHLKSCVRSMHLISGTYIRSGIVDPEQLVGNGISITWHEKQSQHHVTSSCSSVVSETNIQCYMTAWANTGLVSQSYHYCVICITRKTDVVNCNTVQRRMAWLTVWLGIACARVIIVCVHRVARLLIVEMRATQLSLSWTWMTN